jgi:AcrR family transcriptional regulator
VGCDLHQGSDLSRIGPCENLMSSDSPPSPEINTGRAVDRKRTQRKRLIAGMIATAHRDGYAGANVSEVITHAGVSRPTFYEYFANKDDCFCAAHRELSRLLIAEIRRAVTAQRPEQAVQTAIGVLIRLSEEYPERAGFLVSEAMAAGWRGLDERDRLMEEITDVVELARTQAPPSAPTPDLPIQLVFGAGRWLLAAPLRNGERDLAALARDIIGWVESYNAPSSAHRWHAFEPGPEPPPSRHISQVSLHSPPPILPGRPRLSKKEIAINQRERILYATAQQATRKGYNLTTIADITAAAKVDRRVFYNHFHDKQHAFLDVHELGIQQLMAVSASAFFSGRAWPERIWEATRAAGQFQADYPVITHIALVESHAVGASAIQRIDDSRMAFTLFLQEGIQQTGRQVSQTAMEAIAGAVFEICYRQARRGQSRRMSRLAYHGCYVMLAPFIGPSAANEFIDERLREAEAELAHSSAVTTRA